MNESSRCLCASDSDQAVDLLEAYSSRDVNDGLLSSLADDMSSNSSFRPQKRSAPDMLHKPDVPSSVGE